MGNTFAMGNDGVASPGETGGEPSVSHWIRPGARGAGAARPAGPVAGAGSGAGPGAGGGAGPSAGPVNGAASVFASFGRPTTRRFRADLDMAEVDDRERPGLPWGARGIGLSTSSIVIASRRMCYAGRMVLMAVHKIDSEPLPLLGRVCSCEYDADGEYRIDVDLLPMPEEGPIVRWFREFREGRRPA